MRRVIVLILVSLMLAGSILGAVMTYHVVDWQLYRRDTVDLDLRGQAVSVSHYEKLCRKLPDARIRWDVPFQGTALAEDTRELTLTALSREDARVLAEYLPQLRKVNALECADYENLALLKQLRPGVQVEYRVPLNGRNFSGSALQVTLEEPGEEDLIRLNYLPQLSTVAVTGGQPEILEALEAFCADQGISLLCRIRGQDYSADTTVLDVTGITDKELATLQLMPMLRRVTLREPAAAAESLIALREQRAGLDLHWEKTVLGVTFGEDAQKIDLTQVLSLAQGQSPEEKSAYQLCAEHPCLGVDEPEPASVKLLQQHPLPDRTPDTAAMIREVEAAMPYFPEAQTLLMLGCFLDNDKMDAFRTDHLEDYQVVWLVQCGKVATRTDAKFFMPTKYHVYYFQDFESGNLRYLHNIVALDLGHMNISDISFVEEMPDLEYLILAHTSVQKIEALANCKKLKFLEVDWTAVQDLTPLQSCTVLEDLNVGNTWCDLEPLQEMTWLKNLWMIGRNYDLDLVAALPNTHIQVAGTATVDMGWREKPNYFAMRDILQMFYMDW